MELGTYYGKMKRNSEKVYEKYKEILSSKIPLKISELLQKSYKKFGGIQGYWKEIARNW